MQQGISQGIDRKVFYANCRLRLLPSNMYISRSAQLSKGIIMGSKVVIHPPIYILVRGSIVLASIDVDYNTFTIDHCNTGIVQS